MSRSYRVPYVVDSYGSPRKRKAKNYANRVVRHKKDVPSGKAYRKFSCSYDICDYKWYEPVVRDFEKMNGVWEWVSYPKAWNKWRRK